jgi:NAD(P)-dependent dehydrogenase (short-subunit alcohol dehydrogenase family)
MSAQARPLAVVTGASSGIGFELAKCCAKNGFDLIIAADEPAIQDAARSLKPDAPPSYRSRPTWRPSRASSNSTPRSEDVRSLRSSPTPGGVSATPFSIKTSSTSVA